MTQAEYIARRDKLIPLAEKYANETMGPRPKNNSSEWPNNWNKLFAGEMDRLARTNGLIS